MIGPRETPGTETEVLVSRAAEEVCLVDAAKCCF